MIIYSNGCSHTAGTEGYDTYYNDIITRVINPNTSYEWANPTEGHYNTFKNVNFGTLDKNTTYLFKHAEHGKSNDLIFFETYNMVLDSIINNNKIDYAIIQFSGVNRRFHTIPDVDKGVKILHVNPHDHHELGIKFEPLATEQSLQYLIILQELFKKHDINYVFIPYMEFDSSVLNLSSNVDLVDTTKLTCPLYEGHRNSFRALGYCRDGAGHPNYRGYYEIAKRCLDILNIQGIRPVEEYYSSERINFDDDLAQRQDFVKKFSKSLGDGTDYDLRKIGIK